MKKQSSDSSPRMSREENKSNVEPVLRKGADERARNPTGNKRVFKEHKQAGTVLAEDEKWFAAIFNSILAGIVVIDAETRRIVDANPVAVEMIGAPRDEIVGNICHKFICPSETGKCPILDLDETLNKSERILLTAAGASIPILKTVVSIHLAGRKFLLDSFIDISEIKQAERKLKKYSDNLEEIIADRTRELEEIQAQLLEQEKLMVLGKLAGGVGHELRNPLGVMKNSVYFLDMVLEDIPVKAKEHLEIINRQINNAEEIISNLLDFARLKPPTLEYTPVKMLLERALGEAGIPSDICVDLDVPEDAGAVYVDPTQIHSVLLNLLQNSVQAMPEGGELSISTRMVNRYLEIKIADSGCGVPSELISRIFEPLFTTKPKGIGLGLAICSNLVKANRGKISLESGSDDGAVVRLIFPSGRTGDRDE